VREGNLAAGFIRRAVLALPGIPHGPETGSFIVTDLTGCAGGFGSAVAGFGGVVRIFPPCSDCGPPLGWDDRGLNATNVSARSLRQRVRA
jgi:hypothetical protein